MSAPPFADDGEHLQAELGRLDLLLIQRAVRARQTAGGDPRLRGLVVGDEELERLLTRVPGRPLWGGDDETTEARLAASWQEMTARIDARVEATLSANRSLRLLELVGRFQLNPFGFQVLLLTLAPELDLRYERIFGWLHDDLTRSRPSLGLALDLFGGGLPGGLVLRRHFEPGEALGELVTLGDPERPQPRRSLTLRPGVLDWLLHGRCPALPGVRRVDPQPLLLSDEHRARLDALAQTEDKAFITLVGPPGAGRRSFAAAAADAWGCPLFALDSAQINALPADQRDARLADALRVAALEGGVLLWDDPEVPPALIDALAQDRQPVLFVASQRPWVQLDPPAGLPPLVEVRFPVPERALRIALWEALLPEAGRDVHTVAGETFRFHPGAIRAAAHTARGLAAQRPDGAVALQDVLTAGRRHATPKLGALASHVSTEDRWDDLVLPEDRKHLLFDIVRRVRLEHTVLDVWGFGRRSRSARGIAALFSGPPGTGKTMAAAIIARETGRDMFRIDLSQVVSKYIGETEKHLDKVFSEAESTDVALFFDEADALFGKRTAVNDARDRYANIEVSYLLQRIDAYPGLIILATNLRKNMDEAFTRRLDVVVEFPLPDEESRRRIWQRIWPESAPVHEEVDAALLARGLDISGGSIRNIAITSAYLAAEADAPIRNEHILEASRVEFRKLGKVLSSNHLLKQWSPRA
ncbi:MAG: ATP-binding protein [Alphaproteobacteria bacterium]|nr:ATP-binding protein [Alphaproteobacteria bacterium]